MIVTITGADDNTDPDAELGCGLDYAEEWGGDPPPEISALPLLSDAEAGRLLAARRGEVDA